MLDPGKHFQPILIFVGKARSIPLSRTREQCFTWEALALPATRLRRPAWDIHSKLLRTFVNYGRKIFFNTDTWANVLNLIFSS